MACYEDSFAYVNDVRTSQETHLWTATFCYGDVFTILYVDDVRTSRETHLWASMSCYGKDFTFTLFLQSVLCLNMDWTT
jgi:hypothetical protein